LSASDEDVILSSCTYRYSNTFLPSAIQISQRNASNDVISLFLINCRGKLFFGVSLFLHFGQSSKTKQVESGKENYFVTACGLEGKYIEWFSAQRHWLFV